MLRKTVLSLKSPTGAFIVPLRSTNAAWDELVSREHNKGKYDSTWQMLLVAGVDYAKFVGGRPYWVIKDYVPDLFIVSCLSVVLLAIGGILKFKNRRNS